MRISDWSSDVCSSDLMRARRCSPPNGPSGRHIKDAAPAPDAVGLRPGDHRRREQTRKKTAQLWLERMKESSRCPAGAAKEWIIYVKIPQLGRAGRRDGNAEGRARHHPDGGDRTRRKSADPADEMQIGREACRESVCQ